MKYELKILRFEAHAKNFKAILVWSLYAGGSVESLDLFMNQELKMYARAR
jgi:hypothetical protein